MKTYLSNAGDCFCVFAQVDEDVSHVIEHR